MRMNYVQKLHKVDIVESVFANSVNENELHLRMANIAMSLSAIKYNYSTRPEIYYVVFFGCLSKWPHLKSLCQQMRRSGKSVQKKTVYNKHMLVNFQGHQTS